MATDQQIFHTKRRRIDQFINACVVRMRVAAQSQHTDNVQRAAEDLAQSVDELLVLVGGHPLTDTSAHEDCPDCGQVVYPDAVDILAEGEGE